MALSIGITGLPNVGKSTLFNALTDAQALAANYPFATIEPNTGIVPVPDGRLFKLAQLYTPGASRLDAGQGAGEQRTEQYEDDTVRERRSPATQPGAKSASGVGGSAGKQAGAAEGPRIVPATVEFVDIAGLVEGASQGEGLGNQFLSHIRACNAIVQVVRAFKDDNVQRSGSTTPKSDIDVINTELVLADLQTVGNRLPKLEKETKANPKLKPQLDGLKEVKDALDQGRPAAGIRDLRSKIQDLPLLTAKPVIYVFNVDEPGLNDQARQKELAGLAAPAHALFICAKLEAELRGLDEADRQELLASYDQTESGLVQLIQAAYETLGLQSFLTAGEREVRAWTIPRGARAPQAAGVIHGDFEKGFIAAEVVKYQDLIEAGSLAAARAAGKVRTEGKDYIMQPEDVVEFRFNV